MKTFEEFKSEVMKMADIYNSQEHLVDGQPGGLKITIKPKFADYSSDGYMPKYKAGFVVFWGGEHPFISGRYITYDIRFGKFVASVRGCSLEKRWYKNVKNAFKMIFDI